MKVDEERKIYYEEVGGNIGKLLVVEFADSDTAVFNDIINMLERYPNFQKYKLKDESILTLPGLDIRLERRKIYSDSKEISLTTKEIDILCMLVINKERVVTYEQIYQNVWNEFPTSRENGIVGFHVRNLRKKLGMIPFFSIQCTREVGYCFSVESEKMQQFG